MQNGKTGILMLLKLTFQYIYLVSLLSEKNINKANININQKWIYLLFINEDYISFSIALKNKKGYICKRIIEYSPCLMQFPFSLKIFTPYKIC